MELRMGPRRRVPGWRMRKALAEVEAPDLPGRERVTRTAELLSLTSTTMVLMPHSTVSNNMNRNLERMFADYLTLLILKFLKT